MSSQQVLYHSTKYDGSDNYRWPAQLEYARDNIVILYTPSGTAYTGRREGVLKYPFRSYFWTDRWYNVNQSYIFDNGLGIRHYVNLAMPPAFDGSTVSYVDMDLDFDLDNEWGLTLLDEDEYGANSAQFNYPAELRARIELAAQDVRKMVRSRAWPFGTSVENERLRVRPFFWSDLEQIDRWTGSYTPFDDPWLIPAPDTYERHEWFSHYLDTPVGRLYAIESCDGQLIGHMSLREIVAGSQARLGIGLAPTETSKGYGTQALRLFIKYYFDVMGFQRMVLDVAGSNLRAIRAYEKVGFKKYGEHFRSTADEGYWRIVNEPEYVKLKLFFRRSSWGVQQLHYDMEITREGWQAQESRTPRNAR
jgi:diamine N-acetyltransferase